MLELLLGTPMESEGDLVLVLIHWNDDANVCVAKR